MNTYANTVVGHLLSQSWQIALLAGIVGLISLALKNRSAHLRYLLWLIVVVKCLVPSFLTVPLAVLPEGSSSPSVGQTALPEEPFAVETSSLAGGDLPAYQSAPARPSTRALVALTWMAGVLFFSLWVGGRAVRYTAWLRARRRPLPPVLGESIRDLSSSFRFRRWPKVWLLDEISQPFVWGLLRGSVYLPADFVGLDGSDRQRSILAHELSHIARFDAGVNLLQVLAQAVYWFHPFVWWANRKIRQEREKCCDEMAVAHLHTPPEHYTGAIVDALAAERRSAHPIPSLAIVGSVRDIEERIKTMLKPGKTFRTRPSLVAATVALLITLVTIPTALVLTARGQTQPTTRSADKPAANGKEPEQPRYAARTFTSRVARNVRVFVQEEPQFSSLRSVGRAGSAPLQIPACWLWWLSVWPQEENWDSLVQEISQYKVPGLELLDATDSDVRHLAGMTCLESLTFSRDTRITDAGLEYLRGLTGLRSLTLNGADHVQITDAGIACLKGLAGLRALTLFGTQMTDAGLARLVKDRSTLQTLGLGGAKITDAGLASLTGLPRLENLALVEPQITDAGLVHLKSLSGLRELNLGCTQTTDAGLAHLKNLTKLQEIELFRTPITGAGLAHLKDLRSLRKLCLDRTQISDAGLAQLKSLTGLQELSLLETRITDTGLEHVRGLTGLQVLILTATKITDAGLQHIKALTKLRDLWLGDTQITDVALDGLKGLTGLRDLQLRHTQITDAGLEHLKGLTGLQQLDLSATKITDSGLEHLKGLTGLQGLELNGTQITDTGLTHLKNLTRLTMLWLGETQVTDAGVQRFQQSLPRLIVERGQAQPASQTTGQSAQSPNQAAADGEKPEQPRYAARTFSSKAARDVWVFVQEDPQLPSSRFIGRAGPDPLQIPACWLWWLRVWVQEQDWDLMVQEISQYKVPGLELEDVTDANVRHLAGMPWLESLTLTGDITDAGLEYLKGLTGLRSLTLNGAFQVTDAGIACLKGLTGLRELHLAGPRMTDAGLARLVKDLSALRALNVGSFEVTDAGLAQLTGLTKLEYLAVGGPQFTDASLVQLTKSLPGLRKLSLNSSQITDAGLAHLKNLTGLQELDLSWTQITGAGLARLTGLTKLEWLDLSHTPITDAGLEHLKGLTGLRDLSLSDTKVTDAGAQKLQQSLPNLTIKRDSAK